MTAAESGSVIVYAFMSLDLGIESASMAPFKATRQAIEQRFRGRVLEGTAQAVDPDELDDEGRLARIPTGWGDLPG